MKLLQVAPAQLEALPNSSEGMDLLLAKQNKQLLREHVILQSEIGEGEFGTVWSGLYKPGDDASSCTIAVKTMKASAAGDDAQKSFLQEAVIMAQFNSSRVVSLIGVVTKGEPILICLEFMELGSLHSYLRSEFVFEKATDADLIRMASDVCAGMHYLAESGFVHRDLACRNVLVNKDFVCKVSDFGLSRDAASASQTNQVERIPIRWTAPEAVIRGIFSSSSDVWSFGILLWELWSYAAMPYKGWTNEAVMSNVTRGYRMPSPKNCPQFIYSLMLECWTEDPLERPYFYALFERLLAAYNFCKPMTKYETKYVYDSDGMLVRRDSKTMTFTESDMEDAAYDLGGYQPRGQYQSESDSEPKSQAMPQTSPLLYNLPRQDQQAQQQPSQSIPRQPSRYGFPDSVMATMTGSSQLNSSEPQQPTRKSSSYGFENDSQEPFSGTATTQFQSQRSMTSVFGFDETSSVDEFSLTQQMLRQQRAPSVSEPILEIDMSPEPEVLGFPSDADAPRVDNGYLDIDEAA
jgi:serine/threonine protein kinase